MQMATVMGRDRVGVIVLTKTQWRETRKGADGPDEDALAMFAAAEGGHWNLRKPIVLHKPMVKRAPPSVHPLPIMLHKPIVSPRPFSSSRAPVFYSALVHRGRARPWYALGKPMGKHRTGPMLELTSCRSPCSCAGVLQVRPLCLLAALESAFASIPGNDGVLPASRSSDDLLLLHGFLKKAATKRHRRRHAKATGRKFKGRVLLICHNKVRRTSTIPPCLSCHQSAVWSGATARHTHLAFVSNAGSCRS